MVAALLVSEKGGTGAQSAAQAELMGTFLALVSSCSRQNGWVLVSLLVLVQLV